VRGKQTKPWITPAQFSALIELISESASATVTVNAAAGILTLNPRSISFGSVTVGVTSPVLLTTLTNTGNASLTITNDSLSAGDFNWGGQGTCNYPTLAPGASCTYSAKFTPTATGTRTATITIYSTASNSSVTLPLSGTGTAVTSGTLAVSPAAGGSSVAVSAVSSNNSAFSVGGLSLPVTIPAGNSAAFTVTFSPQTTGTVTAALTFHEQCPVLDNRRNPDRNRYGCARTLDQPVVECKHVLECLWL
jgi:Abnormal spindle-like microcephaly-assoc'd, ASPM-SPD-2-Hydin